jgi:hypothetical protein
MDICLDLDDKDGDPFGYLVEVPFLAQVAPVAQVDLLADVWRRHRVLSAAEVSLSGEDAANDFAVHIGQAKVAARVAVG